MKDDLLEKALKYAKTDDYHVTRKIITDLCNEIERFFCGCSMGVHRYDRGLGL